MNKKLTNKQLVHKIYSDPKYAGKHIIAIAGEIYSAKTGDEAARIFTEQVKKHPGEIPMGTFVPEVETLILWRE